VAAKESLTFRVRGLELHLKALISPICLEWLQREANLNAIPHESSDQRAEHGRHVCNMCGKPSKQTICEACSERLRIEALARKKHEEQGDAWSHWE